MKRIIRTSIATVVFTLNMNSTEGMGYVVDPSIVTEDCFMRLQSIAAQFSSDANVHARWQKMETAINEKYDVSGTIDALNRFVTSVLEYVLKTSSCVASKDGVMFLYEQVKQRFHQSVLALKSDDDLQDDEVSGASSSVADAKVSPEDATRELTEEESKLLVITSQGSDSYFAPLAQRVLETISRNHGKLSHDYEISLNTIIDYAKRHREVGQVQDETDDDIVYPEGHPPIIAVAGEQQHDRQDAVIPDVLRPYPELCNLWDPSNVASNPTFGSKKSFYGYVQQEDILLMRQRLGVCTIQYIKIILKLKVVKSVSLKIRNDQWRSISVMEH
ncbi:MAG: hypothetical protein K6C34_03230 [Alphaproteobacteria bacterium]|nr:hypothetical protein [Alphaproteobacteria bacterium]